MYEDESDLTGLSSALSESLLNDDAMAAIRFVSHVRRLSRHPFSVMIDSSNVDVRVLLVRMEQQSEQDEQAETDVRCLVLARSHAVPFSKQGAIASKADARELATAESNVRGLQDAACALQTEIVSVPTANAFLDARIPTRNAASPNGNPSSFEKQLASALAQCQSDGECVHMSYNGADMPQYGPGLHRAGDGNQQPSLSAFRVSCVMLGPGRNHNGCKWALAIATHAATLEDTVAMGKAGGMELDQLQTALVTSPLPNSMAEFKHAHVLGHGSFATVYQSVHIDTGLEIAVKSVDVAKSSQQQLQQELACLYRARNLPGAPTIYGCVTEG